MGLDTHLDEIVAALREKAETFIFIRMIQGDEDSEIIAALVEQLHMHPHLAAALVAKLREGYEKVAAARNEMTIFTFSKVIKGDKDRKIIAALVEKWDMPLVLAAVLVMTARKEYAKVAPSRREIMNFIFAKMLYADHPEIISALVEYWDMHPALAGALVAAAIEKDRKRDAAIAARAPGVEWIVGGCFVIVCALILTGVSYLAAAFLDIHWLIFTGVFIAGLLAILRGIFVLLFGETKL